MEVVFHAPAKAGKVGHLVIMERGRCAAAGLVAAVLGKRRNDSILDGNFPLADGERFFIQHESIRRHLAQDDGLAQAEGGLDEDLLQSGIDRVGGEHHAGDFRGTHHLHGDGGSEKAFHLVMAAVGDGAFAVPGAENGIDGLHQHVPGLGGHVRAKVFTVAGQKAFAQGFHLEGIQIVLVQLACFPEHLVK